MLTASWSAESSRGIARRIVIEGDLVLMSPAHFGNGHGDDITDMPLLVDALDGKTPLLTGASIAGALRSYLREFESGHLAPARNDSHSVLIFGGLKQDEEGEQSSLIVDDAMGEEMGVELREGVKISSKSRTAKNDALFDLQLWQAGTGFPLRFELLVPEASRDEDGGHQEDSMRRALATALSGFNNGGITLGARKRRGYGRVEVKRWRVKEFDLTKIEGLLDWIENGGKRLKDQPDESKIKRSSSIKESLGVEKLIADNRRSFLMAGTFSLDGSLLIRSGGIAGQDPDMVHLSTRNPDDNKDAPILSGTSLGGALRARALKICNTLSNSYAAKPLINSMFGVEMEDGIDPRASRVLTEEHVISTVTSDLVQSRVSIDRFTGGARDGALFNEQPVFGDDRSRLKINVKLINPQEHEIGLLLLLLKDLWTGDLPLGGESSVGRGRLQGVSAELKYRAGEEVKSWKIGSDGKKLILPQNEAAILEGFVAELNSHLKGYPGEDHEKRNQALRGDA